MGIFCVINVTPIDGTLWMHITSDSRSGTDISNNCLQCVFVMTWDSLRKVGSFFIMHASVCGWFYFLLLQPANWNII